jgi:hypothetical protein
VARFQPSPHSRSNPITAVAATLIGAGVSLAGGVASTAVGTVSSKRGQERQIAHEQKMADKQAELALLQARTDDGSAASNAAMQALESIRSKKTMVVAGFGLAGIAVIALTVVLVIRPGSTEYAEEYEDEEYE